MTVSSRLFNDNSEQRVEALVKEMTHQEEREYAFVRTNLHTLPSRQAIYWLWRGFMGVRRAFTNEGFLYLHVKGHSRVWKLDGDPAWALEDGKALDRLVRVRIG